MEASEPLGKYLVFERNFVGTIYVLEIQEYHLMLETIG